MSVEHRHHTPSAEVVAGPAFTLLVGLAAASRAVPEIASAELREALAATGDGEGESWLNLFGVALDAGAPYTVDRLIGSLRALDPVELRRHLLGRYAWSWCTLGGVNDIEAAAAGGDDATARLLGKPRYYGGHARASLGVLLGVDPAETQRRIVAAVEVAATSIQRETEDRLGTAAEEAETALARTSLAEAIEELTTGYRYVPELEADRVILIPHFEPTQPLVLAQHRSARLIAYRVRGDASGAERLVALGRALADPKRVEILTLVGRGSGRPAELVEATCLARSTVHHHLAQLREAGLVSLEGNARSYTYTPRGEAVAEIAASLADVMGTEER